MGKEEDVLAIETAEAVAEPAVHPIDHVGVRFEHLGQEPKPPPSRRRVADATNCKTPRHKISPRRRAHAPRGELHHLAAAVDARQQHVAIHIIERDTQPWEVRGE